MSATQQHNKFMTSIASPAAWYSSSVFLAAVRVAQFASTSTALGLLAYLMSTDNGSGFELAVSAISLAHLLVVVLAPLPLNLYSLIALAVFEVAMLALWTAASGTLGVDYGEYSCSIYSYDDSYNYFFDARSYFSSLARECRAGQASLAFASFSAFLSLCALCLLCVNVLAPMNAVFANGVHPEGASAHLRRFTGLAIARAETAGDVEARASHVIEAPVPVTSGNTPHVTETPASVASDSVPHVTRENSLRVTETPDPVTAP